MENKIYNLSKNEDNKAFNFTFLTEDIDKNECGLLWVEKILFYTIGRFNEVSFIYVDN